MAGHDTRRRGRDGRRDWCRRRRDGGHAARDGCARDTGKDHDDRGERPAWTDPPGVKPDQVRRVISRGR
jgi:hypothetical protein